MTHNKNKVKESFDWTPIIIFGVCLSLFLLIFGGYYFIAKPLIEKRNLEYCGNKDIMFNRLLEDKEKYNCCWEEIIIKDNGAWGNVIKCEAKKYDTKQ